MSQENPDNYNLCLHCTFDKDQRLKILHQSFLKEREKYTDRSHLEMMEQQYKEQRNWLENLSCLQCSEAKMKGQNVNCSFCSSVQHELNQKDLNIQKLEKKCGELRQNVNCSFCSSAQHELNQKDLIIQKLEKKCGELRQNVNCSFCGSVQHELNQKDHSIQKLEKKCGELRKEADAYRNKLEDFKERMSVEASTEMGCCSEIFEDINNPCRESELRKRYEMLRINIWAKCLKKMKEKIKMRKGETADEKKEKEIVERMIKNVFDKASTDMKKKKDSLQKVFKISDNAKSVNNKKQLQCIDMAIQNLQWMILYENLTHYQDTNEELGRNDPDYLCELADQCYKHGCLMALHNPPLTLDWSNKDNHCGCPFPPLK